MTRSPSGHIEQLPSGSWRAKVYAGKDPLTGREILFRKNRKTEVEARIELGKLLALARAGRQPDTEVTVAELRDEYVRVAAELHGTARFLAPTGIQHELLSASDDLAGLRGELLAGPSQSEAPRLATDAQLLSHGVLKRSQAS